MRKKKRLPAVKWEEADDIKEKLRDLISTLDLAWLSPNHIKAFRSYHSSARAYARIWGLPRVWQMALDEKPTYVIEVLSEKFDPLHEDKKIEVLLHEIAHIPKNFSGSLLPHVRRRGKRNFEDRVHDLVREYKTRKKQ